MAKSFQFVFAMIALSLTHSRIFAVTSSIVFYGGGAQSETIVAACDLPLDCERPRINDHGEIVWTERLDVETELFGIFSSVRGLIISGHVTRGPDINNGGEVIWRFGDGGKGPNGIGSSVRGVVLLSTGIDPYYDTQRININGEIIASRELGGVRIWSNLRGDIPTFTIIARDTEINDSGEVVFDGRPGGDGSIIYSTDRGAITSDLVMALRPDINNHGEIVWQQLQQLAVSPEVVPPWEIWSNMQGKIGDGEYPSINDAGEVVWTHWDGHDSEIYSSIRGQLTSNDDFDDEPHINNSGDIVWVRSASAYVPEPSTIVFAAVGMLIGLGQIRQRNRDHVA